MKIAAGVVALAFWVSSLTWAQTDQIPFTSHNLKPKAYSQEENQRVVKLFQGLRTTDVADGLDALGVGDQTWMDPGIKPLWRDEQKFTHRIYGVAVTMRLVPPQTRAPGCGNLPADVCKKWMSELEKLGFDQKYARPRNVTFEGDPRAYSTRYLVTDTVFVIDSRGTRSNGFCGSSNAYGWLLNGVRGVVSETGCRDTDETILERIPIYQRETTFGVNQGREIFESVNDGVVVGGVLVMPNDIIVADGNGVIVVPRAIAEAVATEARKVLELDIVDRGKLYDKAGRPRDFTLTPSK